MHDSVTKARQWLQSGAELRQGLETREAELRAELKEVEDALAQLPGGRRPTQTSRVANGPALTGHKETISKIVIRLVRAAPSGLTVSEIIRGIQAVKPKIKAGSIYPLVYRMSRKTNTLVAEGAKGERRYKAK
jgi:hypothetical protein